MAFGKYRNGPTSLGRQASNWMQDDKLSWSTRRRGDVLVRKSGEFTNIFQSAQLELDGYYSLGRVTDGTTHIVGSPTARGVFADRGLAPAAGGFTVSQLGFYGNGLGNVTSSVADGTGPDFDGKLGTFFNSSNLRTRNGKVLTPYHTESLYLPFGAGNMITWYTRGGYRDVGGVHTFFAGIFFTKIGSSGEHDMAYLYDDGDGVFTDGATNSLTDQLGWYADPLVLAPGALLKMDRYMRPAYSGSSVDVAACPGLQFKYSTDGGLTWSPVASTEMWDAEVATLLAIPTPVANSLLFNQCIGSATIASAPLSRTLSVVFAVVPYVEDVGGTLMPKARVKVGLIDLAAGCTMVGTSILYDGTQDTASLFAGRGITGVKGGALIFTRPVLGDGDRTMWNRPARILFTTNGADIVERAFMPMPEYKTGEVSGIDAATLVCPMFDGEYALYQTRDFGITWTKRATITGRGIPPDGAPTPGAEWFTLRDFPVITCLRKDGVPANAYPATPWLTDSRLPNPPPI